MTAISWSLTHALLPNVRFPVPSDSSLPHRWLEIPARFSQDLSQARQWALDGSVSVQEPSSGSQASSMDPFRARLWRSSEINAGLKWPA